MLDINAMTWTDSNNKKLWIVGTLVPSGDYPKGGDGPDFSNLLPAGYNQCISFVVNGFADETVPENRYQCGSHLGTVASSPGFGNRVLFFDGAAEICQPPNLTVPYPAAITNSAWKFTAIYHKP